MASTVTVFITTYNFEKYLREAVDSALAQTRAPDQIVIADDGSTDRTPELIREMAARHPSIVPVLSPVNRGLSANWNEGFKRCTGDYIATVAGDDVIFPRKLERQIAYMESRPECGISTHEMEVFDQATGRVLFYSDERYAPPKSRGEDYFTTNWFFGRERKVIPSSIVAQRSFLSAAVFEDRFKYWNEWMHTIDCLARTGLRWGHLPERLGRYRMHERQLHTSAEASAASFTELMAILESAEQRYPRFARAIRNKRDFVLFQHLLFDWLPETERAERRAQFARTAGPLKVAYLGVCRALLADRKLFEWTGPLRRWIKHRAAR